MFKNFFFHVLWNKSWLHLFREFNIFQNIFNKKTQPSFACVFLGGLTYGIRMVVSAIRTKLMLQYASSKQKPCPRLSRTSKMGNAFDQQLRKVEVQVLVKLPNWIDYDSSLVWSTGESPAFLTGGLRKISSVSLLDSPKFYSFVIRTLENKICGLLLPSFL